MIQAKLRSTTQRRGPPIAARRLDACRPKLSRVISAASDIHLQGVLGIES